MQVTRPVTLTSLGAGTAAVRNTGVAGATIPILNGPSATWDNLLIAGGGLYNIGLFYGISAAVVQYVQSYGAGTVNHDADTQNFRRGDGGVVFGQLNAAGFDLLGLLRCDSLRVDQAPTNEVNASTAYLIVNCNGADRKVLLA